MIMKKHTGFTLIEVAIVMLIIAALISAAILPLSAQRDTAHIKQAREELKSIEEAIYGFAISQGRLPCPADETTNGSEAATANGGGLDCDVAMGFVPAVTLGLKGEVNCDNLLIDPWGNPYRYSVTTVDTAAAGMDFVSAGEMQAIGAAALTPDLRVCGNIDNNCSAVTAAADIVADNVVAVFFSMGKNWQNPSNAEDENAGEDAPLAGCVNYDVSNDRFFYSSTPRETGNRQFDDIVSWISPNILYAKLLAAGQL